MTTFTMAKADVYHNNFSYTEMRFDINSDFAFSYYKRPFLLVKGEAYPLTKKSLIKYFPKQKEFIQEYMKEHNTNIHSVAPVFELFSNLKQEINH